MILLIRPDGNERDQRAFADQGLASQIVPLLEIKPINPEGANRLADEMASADGKTWLVLTSPRTWANWDCQVEDLAGKLQQGLDGGLHIASIGKSTTNSLPEFAREKVWTSKGISAEELLAQLASIEPSTALIPGSSRSRSVLAGGLRSAGWTVDQVAIYETRQVEQAPEIPDGVTGVVVRSPSAAEALNNLVKVDFPVYAVGPITANKCREYGWQVVELEDTDAGNVAQAVRKHIENR